ncbi:MAG: RNA methyltransferase [Flavobacteriales bacterium]|nr:RNA methyltransferase [Flavobacteriales bacterium]|tara:strand:+ start:618 stop:1352 length:735 start_codon:yes stop_codon:yes gene_type:complete
MWSNKQEKLIRSLQQKKYRKQHSLFVVEGLKSVNELINSDLEIEYIYTTDSIQFNDLEKIDIEATMISELQMKSISSLTNPPGVLAVAKIPEQELITGDLVLYLDEVRDPGNLGTIIRSAEGFGVSQLVLSPNCVDPFSPKVVQASMGSLFRLPLAVESFESLYKRLSNDYSFYAADMDGENLHQYELGMPAVIVMGNESQGLSDDIQSKIKTLSIPIAKSLESLNVAVSAAVILAEFRRQFPL